MDHELSAPIESVMPAEVPQISHRNMGGGAETRLVRIEFRQIAGLPARDFYRILALAIVKEVAKSPTVQNVLNIPLPSTCKEFREFLEKVDSFISGRVMLLMSDTDLLSEAQIRRLRKMVGQSVRGRGLPRCTHFCLTTD